MSKVLRRSDRIQAKRGVKKEAEITIEERVFHDAFLWMEIAQWDLDVFRKLSKITTAMSKKRHTTVDDFAAYRKDIVKNMLNVSHSLCALNDHGGVGYHVSTDYGDHFNPFGPEHFHVCMMSTVIMFRGIHVVKDANADTWQICRAPLWNWETLFADEVTSVKKAIEAYKTNPFADVKLFN